MQEGRIHKVWPTAQVFFATYYLIESKTAQQLNISILCLQEGRTLKVWPIAQVAELQHARYLLQPRALELFLYDHSSALLSFETPKVSLCDYIIWIT